MPSNSTTKVKQNSQRATSVSKQQSKTSTAPPIKTIKPKLIRRTTPRAVANIATSRAVENPRTASVRSGPNGEAGDKWIDAHNPYLASLRDPLHHPGVRVPDAGMSETTTLQVVYHGTVTNVTANKPVGVLLGGWNAIDGTGPFMVPQSALNCDINAGAVAGAILLTTNDNNSIATPFNDAIAPNVGSTPVAFGNLAAFLNSYCSYARVESAALCLRTTANYTTNQGYFIAGSVPPNFFQTAIGNTGFSAYQNAPGTLTAPCIGTLNGVQATYTPMDTRCYDFAPLGITAQVPVTDPRRYPLNPGCLYAFAMGQVANTTMLYDVVINYEIVVASGQLNFGARPTMNDPLAMATAQNARSNDALTARNTLFTGQSTSDEEDELYSSPHFQKITDAVMAKANVQNSQKGWVGPPSTQPVPPGILNAPLDPNCLGMRCHLVNAPLKLPPKSGLAARRRSRSRGRSKSPPSLQQLPEKPLFESLVDGFMSIASKVAPALLSFL